MSNYPFLPLILIYLTTGVGMIAVALAGHFYGSVVRSERKYAIPCGIVAAVMVVALLNVSGLINMV